MPLLAAWLLVTLFYAWTAVSDNVSWRWGEEQSDYYNLLVDGFLEGQLNLKAEVPRELLEAQNPYDPDQRPSGIGLHDASLYRGKYYIYYGVVPAALVLLPWRVLTGVDLPLGAAVLVLVVTGYTVMLAMLAGFRRAFFSRTNVWGLAGLAVAIGFCCCVAILVRRWSMYELPIASGFCFAMLALWGGWRALGASRRVVWLGLSAACWGLAIGSRPTYLFAPAGLLALALWLDRGRARWRNVAVVIVPLALIGAALAWYNYARFGDPREFGVKYILSSVHEAQVEHFRPRYVLWNLSAYFAAGSDWTSEFPFFQGARITMPRPRQHFGMDIPFGLLPHVPFLLLAVAAPLGWRRIGSERRNVWLGMIGPLAIAVAAVLLILSMFYAAMVRYVGDFAPALALLACIGTMELIERWGRAVAGGASALAVFSVSVVFLFSVRVYDRVRGFNPTTYEALARIANAPARAIGGARIDAAGESSGGDARARAELLTPNLDDGVRLRVSFPAGATGSREPLIVSGEKGRGNVIAVEYLSENRLRLVFEHWGRRPYFGPELNYVTGRSYDVVVRHPLYSRAGSRGVAVGKDPLTVEVDGERVWSVVPLFYPARGQQVYLGAEPLGFDGMSKRFGGTIAVATEPDSPRP